jgi:hypothetical protein
VVGASRLGRSPGVRGAGTVAHLTFRAVADGTTALRFASGRALDPLLEPLTPFAAAPATVTVAPALPPGPHPAPREPRHELEGERPRSRS